MNQCTLVFENGHRITINGDIYCVDFAAMSSAEIIKFSKGYLLQHSYLIKILERTSTYGTTEKQL